MRALPCSLSVLVFLAAPLAAAGGDVAATRRKAWEVREVLSCYVGHWQGSGGFVGPDGEMITTAGESVGRFILDGKFVERRSIEAEGGTLQIIGFDARADGFISWVFRTDGATFKASGKWHPKSRMMAWTGTTYRDFRFAAEETHGEGRLRGRWRVSDQRGRELARGTSDDRRVSPIPDRRLFEEALRVVPASAVPELQPLQGFLGPWRETLAVDANGTPIHGAGTYAASWVLGGASQLWRGRRETTFGAEEYVCIFTFDDQGREYRAWRFSSRGDVARYVGEREAGSNAWRWTSDEPRDGIRQTITLEATSPSRVESTTEIWRDSISAGTLDSTATRDDGPAN